MAANGSVWTSTKRFGLDSVPGFQGSITVQPPADGSNQYRHYGFHIPHGVGGGAIVPIDLVGFDISKLQAYGFYCEEDPGSVLHTGATTLITLRFVHGFTGGLANFEFQLRPGESVSFENVFGDLGASPDSIEVVPDPSVDINLYGLILLLK